MKTRNAPAGYIYIGQVAEMMGVTTAMIRQWEKNRLIKSKRTPSGYRIYSIDQLRRMRAVRDLARSGVNPVGIRLSLPKDTSTDAPSRPAGVDQTALGVRLHRLRVAKGISLRKLGSVTGLSASHLSAIERSATNPSVSVLQKLAAGLGTNMVRILGGKPIDKQLIVRPNERRPLDADLNGVEIRQLFRVETVLESLLFVIEPGATSGESYRHEGEEFLFMLEGSLDIVLDETEHFRLQGGDSMTFASHRPHRFSNTGNQQCSVLWINTPPTF